MSEWVSVQERLPDYGDLVVIWWRGDYEFAFYDPALLFDIAGHGWDKKHEATHWLPLPDDPAAGRQK